MPSQRCTSTSHFPWDPTTLWQGTVGGKPPSGQVPCPGGAPVTSNPPPRSHGTGPPLIFTRSWPSTKTCFPRAPRLQARAMNGVFVLLAPCVAVVSPNSRHRRCLRRVSMQQSSRRRCRAYLTFRAREPASGFFFGRQKRPVSPSRSQRRHVTGAGRRKLRMRYGESLLGPSSCGQASDFARHTPGHRNWGTATWPNWCDGPVQDFRHRVPPSPPGLLPCCGGGCCCCCRWSQGRGASQAAVWICGSH